MNNPYTIIEVKPEWRLGQEQMGSKRKFWYSEATDSPRWLFKYAREIIPQVLSGEHWAEKIAEQIAEKMEIPHAKVELAVYQGNRGSTTQSFVTKENPLLVHGNEILCAADKAYESLKTFKQKQHTLEYIFNFFDKVSVKPDDAEGIKCLFASYLILDALISNVDRHHENWGLLFTVVERQLMLRLAPSFDHASSLGRELTDVRRQQILGDGHIGQYVKKGHGAIFFGETGKKAPSPLALIQNALVSYPATFQNALRCLDGVTERDCETVVDNVPEGWMTSSARQFAKALLRYNLEQLNNLRSQVS